MQQKETTLVPCCPNLENTIHIILIVEIIKVFDPLNYIFIIVSTYFFKHLSAFDFKYTDIIDIFDPVINKHANHQKQYYQQLGILGKHYQISSLCRPPSPSGHLYREGTIGVVTPLRDSLNLPFLRTGQSDLLALSQHCQSGR